MRHFAAILIAVAMLAGAGHATAETLKLATVAPEGSPWYEGLRDIAEAWRELSEGRIDVRIYPGGVAGDDPSMVRKMRIGQIHAAAVSTEGLARITEDILAIQLPMLVASDAELDYVRARIGPEIEQALEDKGFKLLTWGGAGWVRLFSRDPIVTPADLKPQRIFASAEGGTLEMWRDRGYEVYGLTVPEIQTALQAGLIDVVPAPPIMALVNQWFGVAKHMTALRMSPFVGAVVITMKSWRRIPEDLRSRFLEIARERGRRLSAELERFEIEAIDTMKRHGLIVHDVPADKVALWNAEIRAAYPAMYRWGVSEDMVHRIEKIRDEFRARARQ